MQRYCRGYLARKAFKLKLHKIILCQSAIRRFLARRYYKKLKAEAKTISHMQKMYKGLENKIISLQQRYDELNKDNKLKAGEIVELKAKLETVITHELKMLRQEVAKKDIIIADVTKQLDKERDEKMGIVEEKDTEEKAWEAQKLKWISENENLKTQVTQMIEMANKQVSIQSHNSRLMSEVDTNELQQGYQRALKDKEQMEHDNQLLRDELQRLSRHGTHSRTMSNASSCNNDEDIGYASPKNMLESKRPSEYNFLVV